MSVFGPFIQEVPARIGHNVALDAAVAVLVNVHTSLVCKKTANEIVSPELYIRAIKTLQTCLENPQLGMSANTLCASVLLGLVEVSVRLLVVIKRSDIQQAFAGPRTGNRYLTHVGGAGRLMELQGPGQHHDNFRKEMLRFNRGGIVSESLAERVRKSCSVALPLAPQPCDKATRSLTHWQIITCIYKRKPCFLASPEWQGIAFDKTGLDLDDCMNNDLMQCMAELPGIFNDLKELSSHYAFAPLDTLNIDLDSGGGLHKLFSGIPPSLDFSTDSYDDLDFLEDLQPIQTPYPTHTPSYTCPHAFARTALLYKVHSLKEALRGVGNHMNTKLANGTAVSETPSREEDSPIRTGYHFSNWRDMTAYNCFWSVIILTDKVLMQLLPPSDPAIYDLQSECRSIALEICKTWEDAWNSRPIGAFHTGLSFVVAYEFCTPDVQEWIIRGLNSLLDYHMVDTFRWSDEVIAYMSSKLAGEGPDLAFSNMRASEDAR
jgi:hypothetical protein